MSLSGIIRGVKHLTIASQQRPLLSAICLQHQQTANYEKIRRFKYPPTNYRRLIKFPEKYTTDPLPVRRLGGRDPETGRVVVKTIGGGLKHKFHWVDFKRERLTQEGSLIEKVAFVKSDFCRTGHIALVASGDQKRWILASENMKAGDFINTSTEIPRIPVRAKEGDSHPLGALPVGTMVHCVEKFEKEGGKFIRAAGTCGQILRKAKGKVIVQLPSKREVCLHERCMATVGRVSNPDHDKTPIGSAQANRWLGRRPRSGLWHRKDGYCGRKIRPIPPMKVYDERKKTKVEFYQLTQ